VTIIQYLVAMDHCKYSRLHGPDVPPYGVSLNVFPLDKILTLFNEGYTVRQKVHISLIK